MRTQWRMVMLVAICAVWTLVFVGDGVAHERRMVGNYQFVVGWGDEPAFSSFKNSVQLILSDASGQPVLDLGNTLNVEVIFGDQKYGPVPMEPAFGATYGRPGDYRTPMIPTRPGAYSFRFTGNVKGAQVDQTFTSSERTFDSPRDPAEVEFPAKDPSRAELAQRVERAGTRTQNTARTNTILAVVGIALGLIALGFGARRGRPATARV